MPSWLVILIVIILVSLIWLAILGAVIAKFDEKSKRHRLMFEEAMSMLAKKQNLLDQFGYREIEIGENQNE